MTSAEAVGVGTAAGAAAEAGATVGGAGAGGGAGAEIRTGATLPHQLTLFLPSSMAA